MPSISKNRNKILDNTKKRKCSRLEDLQISIKRLGEYEKIYKVNPSYETWEIIKLLKKHIKKLRKGKCNG